MALNNERWKKNEFYTVPCVKVDGVEYFYSDTANKTIPYIYDGKRIYYLKPGTSHCDDEYDSLTNNLKQAIFGRIFFINDGRIIICQEAYDFDGDDEKPIVKKLHQMLVNAIVERYHFDRNLVYFCDCGEDIYKLTPLVPKADDNLLKRKEILSQRRNNELEAKYRFYNSMDEKTNR